MVQPIHRYRPQRTPPKILEAIFVAREALLQEILGKLNRWQPGASRQHYLIIGPRGIGKTNLLMLIEHRIRQTPDLRRKWCPVSLSEESYSITRVTDLLIETLRILSGETGDVTIRKVYDQVRSDDNESRVMDLSLDALRRFHTSRGCGVLLMLENVNRILEQQVRSKSEIHLLRKILIEEDWLTLICTSSTYLSAVAEHEEPLFEFFQVQILSELTPDEQYLMLQKIASLKKDVESERYLKKFRSRIRALYHFTGGNPRLTIMLYDLVANQAVTDVTTELDLLLDQLTPFYQDRMKDISEQEGKLIETMALMPEGCTPTELARESRLPAKLVRAILTRLERAGYVRHEERRSKRTVYIIPERFFRIWHQMNHSRTARGRIQYLLEFFSNWYATREERDQIWNELLAKFQQGTANDAHDAHEGQGWQGWQNGGDKDEAEGEKIGGVEDTDCTRRRQRCATALGLLRARNAVETLLECLHDEANNVRGSAATALGRIALEKPISKLPQVTIAFIEAIRNKQRKKMVSFIHPLLRASFRSANLEVVRDTIDAVMSRLSDAEALCAPYTLALEYLQSGRDPAVMDRQHQEMREAIQLLVDAFDKGWN